MPLWSCSLVSAIPAELQCLQCLLRVRIAFVGHGPSETSCTRLRLLFRLLPVHHQHLLGCQAGPWHCSGAVDGERSHRASTSELHRLGCMPSLQPGMPRA